MNKKIIITLIILAILLIFISVGARANIIEKIKVVPNQPDLVIQNNNITASEYLDNNIYATDYELEAKLTKAEEITEMEIEKLNKS